MFIVPAFYKFRNSEFIQYQIDFIKIINQHNPKALQITTQLMALQEQTTAMDDVYKKQLGSTITSELEALDKRRDLAIIGIRSVAEGFTYHHDPAKHTAAGKLLQSIDQYGDRISKQNYQEETTSLRNLTDDWHNILILKAALVTLDLMDWAMELKESNESFNVKYLERNREYALDSKINVTKLRDGAKARYSDLIAHLTAHAILSPCLAYDTVIKEINTLTDQYNDLVQKRSMTNAAIAEELPQG